MSLSRKVIEQNHAQAASDGDGVKLLRVFGGHNSERYDPFLLTDEFGSDTASDYVGGFPSHPHRGFETITYMLQGKMEHQDHLGNVGLLGDGDVQWMTAGRGVIHSEMPKQTEGMMRGFQVWLNLPADKKMQPARYEDVSGTKIPSFSLPSGKINAIAGKCRVDDQIITGYFQVPDTQAIYLDIHLVENSDLTLQIEQGFNVILYAYEGKVSVGEDAVDIPAQSFARLELSGDVHLKNQEQSIAKLILLAGKPINEPIAQYGPFVMNSDEQIKQAIEDYRNGTFISS